MLRLPELNQRSLLPRKKSFVTVLGCAVVICAFIGIDSKLPKQQPIELETVADSPGKKISRKHLLKLPPKVLF